jgi:uncharacterized membrane protein (UPF0127 family)
VTRSSLRALVAPMLAAASLAAAADAAAPLPRLQLEAGAHSFDVEVAATPEQRERGLMERTHLADDAGMLFVFEQKARHCFWMKNTPLPLSIAFIADDGSIVEIDDMQPLTTDPHCVHEAVRYALEVKQGGFSDKDIGAGTRVTGGPFDTVPPRRQD